MRTPLVLSLVAVATFNLGCLAVADGLPLSADGGVDGGGGGPGPDGGAGADAGAGGGGPATGCAPGFIDGGAGCVKDPADLGTTFFVSPAGGTGAQCDGLSSAAWSAQANGHCAWVHPFVAVPPRGSSWPTRLEGGDTLIIGAGSYAIGAGAVSGLEAEGCTVGDPGPCEMSPLPSGTAADPTRVLGEGYERGCAAPPELWGSYRTPALFNLTDTDHLELACLDLTDHAQCSRFHHQSGFACANDGFVEGYAYEGLSARDSEDVRLVDLRIHGLDTAIHAGRVADWTLERVVLRGNLYAGWDGDLGGGDSSNAGTLTFADSRFEWSGCLERWPAPGGEPVGCMSQDTGGYGDALGTARTNGRWVFRDTDFLWNVSDGLDLLYLDTAGQAEVHGGRFEGNAGNALKLANGGAVIDGATVVGNCGFFDQPGKWPAMVNHCRAVGDAIALFAVPGGSTAPFRLSRLSVWSEGDCAIAYELPVVVERSVFRGAVDYHQPFEQSCFAYTESPGVTLTASHVVVFGFKGGCEYGVGPAGEAGHCTTDPKLVSGPGTGSGANPALAFDLRLAADSPYRNYTPALGAP